MFHVSIGGGEVEYDEIDVHLELWASSGCGSVAPMLRDNFILIHRNTFFMRSKMLLWPTRNEIIFRIGSDSFKVTFFFFRTVKRAEKCTLPSRFCENIYESKELYIEYVALNIFSNIRIQIGRNTFRLFREVEVINMRSQRENTIEIQAGCVTYFDNSIF